MICVKIVIMRDNSDERQEAQSLEEQFRESAGPLFGHLKGAEIVSSELGDNGTSFTLVLQAAYLVNPDYDVSLELSFEKVSEFFSTYKSDAQGLDDHEITGLFFKDGGNKPVFIGKAEWIISFKAEQIYVRINDEEPGLPPPKPAGEREGQSG